MASIGLINQDTIIFGDCLNVMKEIKDKSIDAVICDLPYGSTACAWDVVIPFQELWSEYKRIVKDNGAIVLFGNNPFSSQLISSNLKMYKYDWIIEKTHTTGHLNAKKRPMKTHELIHVFYKKLPIYNPQKTQGHVRKKIVKRKTETELYGKESGEVQIYDSTERYPRSVQKFKWDKQNSSRHSTQKPVELYEYLIKTYTNEGEVILDNCSGSGTIAIAAINTKRHFIAIEKNEIEYLKSCERLESHKNGRGIECLWINPEAVKNIFQMTINDFMEVSNDQLDMARV